MSILRSLNYQLLFAASFLWFVPLASFTQAPANNLPCNATLLNVGSSCVYANYNSTNATPSTVPQPTGTNCSGWGQGRDVWFRAVVPSNGAITVSANESSPLFTDGVMAAYRGPDCNNLTLIRCDDDGGPGLMPQISLVGETPGTTIWFRFWRHSNSALFTGGNFQICATNSVPTVQDCLGAIPICQLSYSTTNSYTGMGNIPNETPVGSCLLNSERNSVWYTFTVQNSGNLNFTITPNILTNDYDWAVFNLTNANCSDIPNNLSLQVSCNYSSTTGNTGTQNGSTQNSQGAAGNPFNAPIPVQAGQTYAVLVSNFSTTNQSGYTINFGASTATIVDNVAPRLRLLDSIPVCGNNVLHFSFSENVRCNTVQPGDFVITGPGGVNHPVTAVNSVYCQLGTTYDNQFSISTSAPFLQPGNYTLCLTSAAGNVEDLCGNLSQSTSPCLSFTITDISLTTSRTDVTCRNGNNGTATVSATGAGGNYTYAWSNGGTTPTINGLVAGTYTVTVTSGQCSKTANVNVTEPATGINTTTSTTPANCGQADGSATVTPSNGVGAYTFIWSSGQTTSTANNIAAGNYSVTVRDANNCSAVAAVVVPNQNSTLAISVSGDTSCFSQLQAVVAVTATGGVPGYTYLWSNGQTTPTISNLANGVYSVTVRDAVNCSVTATTGVLRYPNITFNPPTSTPSNCGQNDGTATINPTGGGGGFTYLWSNGQTTQTAVNLVSGNYFVTVRDANNCTATSNVNVANQPSTLNITLRGDTSCSAPTATRVVVTATGGSAPYTYLWSNGITTDTVENLANGVYTVTVRDAVNCTVSGSTGVLRYPPISFLAPVVINASCNFNNGSATVNPTGGAGNFTFLWSNGQTAQTAQNLAAGSFTVTTTDAAQCTETTSINVTQLGAPNLTVTKTDVACFGGNNGTATATTSGGASPVNYAWSNGQNTQTVITLTAGSYTVTATDVNNCSVVGNIAVNQPDSLTISSANIIHASCFGASDGGIEITTGGGTGNIAASWSNGQTGNNASALAANNYTVTITDANNCTLSRSFAVNQPTDIVIQINTTDVACFGGNTGSAAASASGSNGNFTFNWSNGQSGATINNLVAGNYTVTVSSVQCTKTAQTTINQPAQEISISFTTTNSSCGQADGTATANASNGFGNYTFNWSNGQTSQTATALVPGNYSVTVRDGNNCSATGNTTVQNQNSTLNVVARGDTACGNIGQGRALSIVSGGVPPYVINWSNGGTTDTIQNLANGVYSITVTDAQNCSVTASTNVLRFPEITFNPPVTSPAVCGLDNGSATVNATNGGGNFSFLWSNGQTTQTITNLAAGVFSVTVTDANQCTAETLISVAQDGGPDIVDTSQTNVSCFGGNNGSATVLAAGGAGNITYLWSNGQSGQTISNLTAGNYIITATDGNGCIATQIFSITQPSAIMLTNSVVTPPFCTGGLNGSIFAEFSGGSGTLTLTWSNGGTGNTISNIGGGVYQVTATDQNNCVNIRNFSVIPPTPVFVNVTATDALCFGANSGTATATASGGTPPYSFQWSGSNVNSSSISQLFAGSYQLTVTDANNCSGTLSFNVGEAPQLSVVAASTAESCPGSADGTISPSGLGGTFPYTFELNGNGISSTSSTIFDELPVGTYSVTVRDANNCTATIQQSVAAAQEDAFNVETDSTTCFGDVYRDGSITVSPVFPVNGPYTYSLDGLNYRSSGLFDSLGYGNYLIYVKSEKGCESTLSATVYQPEKLAAVISPNVLTLELGESATVDVSVNNKYNLSYAWSPSSGLSCNDCPSPVISPFNETVYTLTVKDSRGNKKFCTATAKLTVEVGPHGEIFIPNLFSPNADGVNDVFLVHANQVRDLNLRVFNRWGEKVFESNNIAQGWDGTYKGVLQMPGVFTYTAEFVFLNNMRVFKSGTITLTR